MEEICHRFVEAMVLVGFAIILIGAAKILVGYVRFEFGVLTLGGLIIIRTLISFFIGREREEIRRDFAEAEAA